jgi:hypothetical protein
VSTLIVGAAALAVGIHLSRASSFDPDPIFPVGPISDTTSHQIAKLDQVAAKLAGRKATVNCWSQHDWARLQGWQSAHHSYALVDALGVTWFQTHRIELSPFICEVLAQVLGRSAQQPLFTAEAVQVLAHESAHASGIKAENRAECKAIETDRQAALLLGLSPAAATELPHIYRGTIYPYDEPRYRTPVCPAGLPGVVIPDTLGTASDLRPLRTAAAAAARVVEHWKNRGGAESVGPLSPCSPAVSRTDERARFGEGFLGPRGESLQLTATRLDTPREFRVALGRYKVLDRCDLLALRKLVKEDHTPATITYGRIPASITRLSPAVLAYRDIWTESGQKWNRDTIIVLNRTQRSWTHLFFRFPPGRLPLSVEIRATKALLRASR